LLYSKFSPACKELFRLLQEHSLQPMFKLLDVDNKDIRRRIQQDKKFIIKTVPCVVSVSSNGVASQYEGSKAFDVVKVMIQQLLPPQPPIQQTTNFQQPTTTTSSSYSSSSSSHSSSAPPSAPPSTVIIPESDNNPQENVTLLENLIDEIETETKMTASRQSHNFNGIQRDENQYPNHDRNVTSAIKGEKISVSSIMNQAQQTNDVNPPPTQQRHQQPPPSTTEGPKKQVEKVNVASIMASRN
jgi:hypothetical protein